MRYAVRRVDHESGATTIQVLDDSDPILDMTPREAGQLGAWLYEEAARIEDERDAPPTASNHAEPAPSAQNATGGGG